MTGAIENLFQVLNHKISNLIIASGLVVVGRFSENLTPPQYKPISEVSVIEIFTEPQSAGTYFSAVGCCWIMMQMLAMMIKTSIWAYKKIKGGE